MPTIFLEPPTAPKVTPPCCGGMFFGVPIPDDIPVYDARLRDGDSFPSAPWGELYYSRGAVALGVKTGRLADHGVYTSFGCQDTREEANAAQTQATLRQAIAAFRREAREGSEIPVGIEVENFAITLIRTCPHEEKEHPHV